MVKTDSASVSENSGISSFLLAASAVAGWVQTGPTAEATAARPVAMIAVAEVAESDSERSGNSGLHHIDHGVAGIRSLGRHASRHAAGALNASVEGTGSMVADRLGIEHDQSERTPSAALPIRNMVSSGSRWASP